MAKNFIAIGPFIYGLPVKDYMESNPFDSLNSAATTAFAHYHHSFCSEGLPRFSPEDLPVRVEYRIYVDETDPDADNMFCKNRKRCVCVSMNFWVPTSVTSQIERLPIVDFLTKDDHESL